MREMPNKIGFVDGDVLDGDDALARLEFEDAINQKKGVAMRQIFEDAANVDGCHEGSLGNPMRADSARRRWRN